MAAYVLSDYWLRGYAEGDALNVWVTASITPTADFTVSVPSFGSFVVSASASPDPVAITNPSRGTFTVSPEPLPSEWAVGA